MLLLALLLKGKGGARRGGLVVLSHTTWSKDIGLLQPEQSVTRGRRRLPTTIEGNNRIYGHLDTCITAVLETQATMRCWMRVAYGYRQRDVCSCAFLCVHAPRESESERVSGAARALDRDSGRQP